jgi:L-sorbose 1-phosphate reductase
MPDKLTEYQLAATSLPEKNRLWPLYGAGFGNLGRDGQPIDAPLPEYGPDELLVRHDAVGLCFSDIKLLHLGEDHPRIYRNMQEQPVVQGHEVSMTVVGVGECLRDQYQVGDRFIIQADIFVGGVGYAYGYEIQGGLSQYGVIDQRVLNGDHGNYLIPVQPETGYAESALTEPWACVIAAYQLEYRTALRSGGTAWIIGTPSARDIYTFSAGFGDDAHPGLLLLTQVPGAFASWLKQQATVLGIEVLDVPDIEDPKAPVDDIVLLGADADIIETVSPHLADYGVMALVADQPLPRKVAIDVGRIHYNRWLYVGASGPDITQAYSRTPVRSALKPGGRAWFVGAGGPMGRMHVQRAIHLVQGPGTIICTDVSDLRLDDLCATFAAEAEGKGIEWLCLNPLHKEIYEMAMARFQDEGFDDIVVLAPVAPVIADAATYLAPKGVMNVFAGVARGTKVDIDLDGTYLRDTRVIGHSASTIEDLRLMLSQAESGQLSPNRSVAAIGSLGAARDGLQAVQDTVYPGKVVIYPHIKEMPLTALPDLKDSLPTVYARLRDGREWTLAAERELLRVMLP